MIGQGEAVLQARHEQWVATDDSQRCGWRGGPVVGPHLHAAPPPLTPSYSIQNSNKNNILQAIQLIALARYLLGLPKPYNTLAADRNVAVGA